MDPSATTAQRPRTARELIQSSRLLIAAHRGASFVTPENTLPAFKEAIACGADLVELDYMHSADGVPVVFHDKCLDRTTNSVALWHQRDVPIASKQVAELQMLDAGAWFHPRFSGTRIPTLEEALDLIQPAAVTLVERKVGDAATCVNLLKRKGYLESVVLMAFDWDFLAEAHRLAPDLVLCALGEEQLTPEKLARVRATGAKIVAWDQRYLGPAEIAQIHERGFRAWTWTVDDVARGRALRAAGIDSITTNEPAAMRAGLAGP